MSVIRIPSKNIYQKENQKIIDNIIDKVEATQNSISAKFGNVLDKEYTFDFFAIEYDNDGKISIRNHLTEALSTYYTEGIKIAYRPYQPNPSAMPEYYIAQSVMDFDLHIDKLCIVKTNAIGDKITSHQWYSKQTIAIVNTSSNDFTRTERITLVDPNIINYDKESGTIKVSYSAQIAYPISSVESWIVLSDTFYIQGDYFEGNDVEISYGDGNNVMSFSGNELMQTTNSPSLEEQYQTVIKSWQNGKETATLRCSIDVYYDNDTGELLISANGKDTLPMTFKIDDIVTPYVCGSNGQEKPMSTYLDGAPKQFKVVGKRPYYDGAVWQEITLQETINPNQVIIKLNSIVNIIGSLVEVDYSLVEGNLKLYDNIRYNGETATINKNSNGKLVLYVMLDGQFYQKIGQTIIATKVN